MHQISTSAGPINPTVVTDYRVSREIRTREHPILGAAWSDFTFRPPGPRSGTLTLVFGTEGEAVTAVDRLLLGESFLFTTDALGLADMAFVVVPPGIDYALGAAGGWVVTVPYKEVTT